MPKIITKETHDEILRLHFEEGLSFSEISKRVAVGRNKIAELCGDEKARRADQELEEDRERERKQSTQKIEAKVFSELGRGKNPADLVAEGVCSVDSAKELGEKYTELRNMSRPNLEIIEARLENASYLLRSTLGNAKIEVHCPICHKWTYLKLQKIGGSERWACGNCGRIPF